MPENAVTRAADTVKAVSHAVLWLGVLAVAFAVFVSRNYRLRVHSMIEELGIHKLGEVEFDVGKVEDAITQLTGQQERQKVGQNPLTSDVTAASQVTRLLAATQASKDAERPTDFWVYIGEYDTAKKKYLSRPNFLVDSRVPHLDGTISATTDVYRRQSAPTKTGANWQLGKVIGVVQEGEPVLVKEVREIEGDTATTPNLWVRASLPS